METLKHSFDVMKLKVKDFAKLKFSFNLVVVHSACAVLVPMEALATRTSPPDQPGGVRDLRRDVVRSTEILFDYDSATLMARDEFELRLAVDRRLFTEADGMAAASGFASPEGRDNYNSTLSAARAEAVVQAVRDAFGNGLALTRIRQFGFGEGPALGRPRQPARPLAARDRANPATGG